MRQTTKKWFETIQNPNIRDKAIANTNPWDLETDRFSLLESLTDAFLWEDSPERHKFWFDFTSTLNNK
jgi:hypothetical protein